MNEETKMMINAIVDEMGKMESRINNHFSEMNERFNKIDMQLLSMQHDINACKHYLNDEMDTLMAVLEEHITIRETTV